MRWDVVKDEIKLSVFSRHNDTVNQLPQIGILEGLPSPSPPVKFPPMSVDPDALNAELAVTEYDKAGKRRVPVQGFADSKNYRRQLCPVDRLLAPRRGADVVW